MSQLKPRTQAPAFAGREPELKIVTDRLVKLHRGDADLWCVINFYGIRDIGKTELLLEILRCAQSGEWHGLKLPPTLSALADFGSKPDFQKPYRGGPGVLADLMGQLEEQTKESDKRFFEAMKAFRAVPMPDSREEEDWYGFWRRARQVAAAFSLYVDRHTEQRKAPVVLLFDNTGAFPGEAFDWLESEVFSYLLQTERVLLILAGRSPIRWKRFEVRRRVLLHRLRPPENGVLIEQQAPSWAKVASNIHQITFNYAPANEAIFEELEQLKNGQQITEQTFHQVQPQLIQRLVNDVLDRNLLAGVEPDLRLALRTIAPLRQFGVAMLKAILPEFQTQQYEGRGGNYYLMMLNRMVDTTLVEWSTERKAYVLDDTVRNMLALHLETSDHPLAEGIHQQAAKLYRRWLVEMPENRSPYTIEWLYHHAQAMRLQGKSRLQITTELQELLQTVLDQFYREAGAEDPRFLDRTRRLLEELPRDRELLDLLAKDAGPRLVQCIEEAVR